MLAIDIRWYSFTPPQWPTLWPPLTAYRKNDQAWVEQKNGAVIRRFLGHERYSGRWSGRPLPTCTGCCGCT